MLNPMRWQSRVVISIVVIGGVLLGAGVVALQSNQPDPEQLLGIPLPPSTVNLNVDIQRQFIGEYHAYLRFELAPRDVAALLADPAFQPITTNTNPLVGIGTASQGGTSLATIVQREHPAWWNPPLEGSYLLAYRSRPTPPTSYTGPDASWYVIDTSDPTHTIVYVYVVEV